MKTIAVLFTCIAVALAFSQTVSRVDYQISGVVVDHLTNRPLNHVLVMVVSTGKGGGNASALTEADGRFTFLHVPKGKYQLMAEKRGQNPQGFHSDGSYATAIVVDGRQKTDGIVFAMRTDASIDGSVIADDAEPIRNAQVDLFWDTVNEGEAEIVQLRGVSTNSSGQFHFGHLDPGNYYVSVQATPWFAATGIGQEVVYPITFYGDTTDGNSARVITLQEGGSASLQINLHAVPGIRVKLGEQTHAFGLFVPGPGGARIPVPAIFSGANQGFIMRGGGGLYTPRQKNGPSDISMELSNLAPGRYEVMAYGENGGAGQSIETVDLADGSTLTFGNSAPTSIAGTVLFDHARPKGDLQVVLSSGGHRGSVMTSVAADGSFRFERTAAGKFDIFLNRSDLVISSIAAKGARVVHDKLDVPAGASVDLTIRTGGAESTVNLEGFATRGGIGMAGAMVLLLPEDLGRTRLIRRDQSDADGSFTLQGVPAGRYTLVAIDDGRDLAYKSEALIKPYLQRGLPITIPLKSNEAIKVPVQGRRP